MPAVPTVRSFLMGGVAIGLALAAQRILDSDAPGVALVLFALALVLWLWATLGMASAQGAQAARSFVAGRQLHVASWTWLPHRLRHSPLILAILLSSAAIGLSVWDRFTVDVARPTDADWLRYSVSVGLALVAAILVERRASGPALPRVGSFVTITVIAVVALGAVVRLLDLGGLPFGTWYDEAANGLEAMRMMREAAFRPFYTDGVNATGHYLLLIVTAFTLLDVSTESIRLVSACMGIASVVAAYFFGRELHSATLGLVLAFMMAVARWSITFSRLGMYNMATPLFELLALLFILRGLRRGSVLDFALAGLSIGLGLSFYSAFQLFLAVIVIAGLYLAWQERANWPRLWLGAGIMLLVTLLVVAPVVHYALVKPDSYFARVQKTSLFSGKEPAERLPALWRNTVKHVLMFNVRGDPNGRHNLPGAPMVDWVTGGLLVLGLAYCVVNARKPDALLGPVWAAVGLLGGILSLDFEAPQSLRSIGAQPAVLLIAAWPLVQLDAWWRGGAGRYAPYVANVVIAVLLVPMAYANIHTYFVRQAKHFSAWNVHSTSESLAADLLRTMSPDTQAYLIALYDGHPTVRFLAQDIPYRRVETSATLPIAHDVEGDLLLILDVERRKLFEQAQRLYPEAEFTEVHAPFGGPPTLLTVRVSAAQLRSIQGLTVTYQPDLGQPDVAPAAVAQDASTGTFAQPGAVDLMWPEDAPLPLPFVAEWSGVISVGTYGRYQFFVEAPGEVELRIGGALLLDGVAAGRLAAEAVLARGMQPISLRAQGGEGRVRLAWQTPDGPPATVPVWALYHEPVRSNGLLGRYFANGDWSGEPSLVQIDPSLGMYFHVPILPRPYTVLWDGKLATPIAGRYGFALQSIDESELTINGEVIASSNGANQMARGSAELAAGLHDISVKFGDRTNHTYINLYWLPPGSSGPEAYQILPGDFLFPPQADLSAVDVADLGRFLRPISTESPRSIEELLDSARVEIALSGLDEPRGVAVLAGMVYVAESGGARLVAYDPQSGESRAVALAPVILVEPFDLAVHPSGRLVILDALLPGLLMLDPDTGEVTSLPVDPSLIDRSRGISVGQDGLIWIANTPSRRVVAVNLDGVIVHELTLPPATDGSPSLQPVDVMPMDDNTVFLTDVGGHQLLRFDRTGYLLQSAPIPVANSLDGPHLAVGVASVSVAADIDINTVAEIDGGRLYLSQPEAGVVVMLDAVGNSLAAWSVRTADAPDGKPIGLAVDETGTVWVADVDGGRLLRLDPVE